MSLRNIDFFPGFIPDENGNLPDHITDENDGTENPVKPPRQNVMSGNPFSRRTQSSNTISFTSPFAFIRGGRSRRGVSNQKSNS